MKKFNLFIIFIMILTLIFTGCGKKSTVTTKPKPADVPMSTVGFGTLSGTCSVCKAKSDHLLAVKQGEYKATVCSQACGDKFRADPTYYSEH